MGWQLELEKKLEKVKGNEDLWVVIEDGIVEILEREEGNEPIKIGKSLKRKIFEILKDSLKDNNWSCCNSCLRFVWTLIQYKSLKYNDVDEKNIKVLMNVYYSIVSVSQKNQVVELEFATLLRNITGFFMSWVDEYYLEISKMDIEEAGTRYINDQTPFFMKDKVMLEKYIHSLFELLTMIEPKRSNCNGVLEYLYIGHSFILSSRYAAETYTMIQQISSIQKSNCYLPSSFMEMCVKRFLSCPDFDLQLILGELIWRVLKKSNYVRGYSQGDNEEYSFIEIFRSSWPEGLIQIRYIGTENFDFSFRGLLTPWNKTCNGNGKNIWSLSGVLIQMQGLEIKLVTVIDICAFSIVFHSDIDEEEFQSNQSRYSNEMGNTEEKDLKPFVSTAEIPYWTIQSVVYDDDKNNLHINVVFSEILEIRQSWTGIFSTNIENLQSNPKMKNEILKVSLNIDEEQAYQIMGIFKASKIEKIQGMKHIETPSKKVSIVDSRMVSIKELNKMDQNNIILESVENKYRNFENVKMSIATSKTTSNKNNLYDQVDNNGKRVSFVSSKECNQADSDKRSSSLVIKELEKENIRLDSNTSESQKKKSKADVIIIGLINEQKKLTQEIMSSESSSESSEPDLDLTEKEAQEDTMNISNAKLIDKSKETDKKVKLEAKKDERNLNNKVIDNFKDYDLEGNRVDNKGNKCIRTSKNPKLKVMSKTLNENEIDIKIGKENGRLELEEENKEKRSNLNNFKVLGSVLDENSKDSHKLECNNVKTTRGLKKKERTNKEVQSCKDKEEKANKMVKATSKKFINLKKGKKVETKGKGMDEEKTINEENLGKKEEEELRKNKENEELMKEKEELRKKMEEELKRKKEEELRKKMKEEELKRKKEEDLKIAKEEELKRKKEEELRKKMEEEELKKKKEEELKIAKEEELRRKKEEELRKKMEEEELKKKKEEELKKAKEEELRRKKEYELRKKIEKKEEIKRKKQTNNEKEQEKNIIKAKHNEIEGVSKLNLAENRFLENNVDTFNGFKDNHDGKEEKKVNFPISTLDQTNKRASGLKRGRFNKEYNELKIGVAHERISYNTVRDIVFGRKSPEKKNSNPEVSVEFKENKEPPKKGNKKKNEVFTPVIKKVEAPKAFEDSIDKEKLKSITMENDTTCPTRIKARDEKDKDEEEKNKMIIEKGKTKQIEENDGEIRSIVPIEIAVLDNDYPILGSFDEFKEYEEIEMKKRKYSSDSRSDKLLNMWISEIKGTNSDQILQDSNDNEEKTPRIINIGLNNKKKNKVKQKSRSKIKEVAENLYCLEGKKSPEVYFDKTENYDTEESKSVIFSGINKILEQVTEGENKGFSSLNSADLCDNLSCITGTEIIEDIVGKSKKRGFCDYSLKSFNSVGKMSIEDSIYSPDTTFDDNITVTNYSFIVKMKENDNNESNNQSESYCGLPSELCISNVKLDENKQLENALAKLETTSKGLYEKCQKKLETYFLLIKSHIENIWDKKINIFAQKRKELTLKVEANRIQIENDYLNLKKKYMTDLQIIGEKINKEKTKLKRENLEKDKNTDGQEQGKLSIGKKVLFGLKEEIEREKKKVQNSIKLLSEKKQMEKNRYRKSTTKKLDLRQILKSMIINEESE
ncbi:uncharacterized protein cubi_03185 [Cryptosporidium ubiquitum]|uniref:Uncharacterized protein n=1 Tax=Cryptosporidium ubiquitum TaxID=857276 RepID=A0A1J4MLP9_9CRYT|nr:uncharacterized protein cubi_03185 [Cryptosporidium ubiquitum]OII75169.1 hypothetical protein cubi_03185 [Cryptosporidium ubiquitum]